MKVFIAAVSSETQHVGSLSSIFELNRGSGDELFLEHKTRGDVARESMADEFLRRPEFDALLMLDADQRHPKIMLDVLRKDMQDGDLDMVCAHYYRRDTNPVQSLCYELTGDETYPFLPILHPPTEGLHEIAVTGLGCVLIHRRVMEGLAATLPNGASPFAIGTLPDEGNDHQNWGSDFRFFIMARRLGFKLWLDARLESLHAVNIWLGHNAANKLVNYTKWADAAQELLDERIKLHGMDIEALKQRRRILQAREEGLLQQAEPFKQKRDSESIQALTDISLAIYEVGGRLKEVEAWLDWMEKYPRIERPDQLPTTENTPVQNHMEGMDEESLKAERRELYRNQGQEIVDELPNLRGQGRR